MKILRQQLAATGIETTDEQLVKFEKYTWLLKEWSKKINLTAITDEKEIAIKHFYDSLSLIITGMVKEDEQISLIDIGSGAGFPGLPLKIWNKNLNVILVDSTRKKIVFLEKVIEELGLTGIQAIWGRAEELGHDVSFREKFSIVTARAVAPLNVLLEYSLPFAAVNGKCVFMKGQKYQEEIAEAEKVLALLGGKIAGVERVTLPLVKEDRFLICIDKVRNTPEKYPRRPGIPKKRPLV